MPTLDVAPSQLAAPVEAEQTFVGLPASALPHAVRGELHRDLPIARVVYPSLGPDYQIERKLGQGGMGAVYLGRRTSDGLRVAIKTISLQSDEMSDSATLRFEKEIRLLGEVQHPNVANRLAVGHWHDLRFLVMELVEGTDVRQLLRHRGRLPESVALQITAAVAEALAVAHRRGIIHRDLKPGNILLSAGSHTLNEQATASSPADAVHQLVDAGQCPVVKLSDFGLARHLDQRASLDLTRTGALLGTPYYIAPEQCSETARLTPAADIYSLGATLFELLTGQPPFLSDDPVRVITMHCFEAAPDPRKLVASISDGTAALVARMLRKDPLERFADAGHLLESLQVLLRGEAVSTVAHPVAPAHTGRVFETVWEWELAASPEQIWPYASNTERINAAVGLPPVEYITRRDEHGVKRRFGSFRLGWTRLTWEEHPFEWVEGQRLGVLREFANGPFRWFVSIVELSRRPQGGTLLRHTVRIAPRNWLGRVLAHIEVNVKGRKPLDRVYRHIDEVLCAGGGTLRASDPFVPPGRPPALVQKKLSTVRQQLAAPQATSAGAWAALGSLFEFLSQAPPQELARIRPRVLARRLNVVPDELTTACLESCQAGLLELHWDLLCPTCRVASATTHSLAALDSHAQCESCDARFQVDVASNVEMTFQSHPDFRVADTRFYCIGGPEHAPHVVAQCRLLPGERLELELALDEGSYLLRGAQLAYTIPVRIEREHPLSHASVLMSTTPRVTSLVLSAQRQRLILQNEFSHDLVLRLERAVQRDNCITAADALRLPAFRRLFPAEVVTREALANISTNTLLALRVGNVLELFSELDESAATAQLNALLAACTAEIAAQGGRVIRQQDDGLIAAFPGANGALSTALALQRGSQGAGPLSDLPLQMVLHRGAAFTQTGGATDSMGRLLAQTSRLLSHVPPGSIGLSEALAEDPGPLEMIEQARCDVRRVTAGTSLMLMITYQVVLPEEIAGS